MKPETCAPASFLTQAGPQCFSSSEAQTLSRSRARLLAIIAPSSRQEEGNCRINTKGKSFLLAAKATVKAPIFSVEKNQLTTVSFFADVSPFCALLYKALTRVSFSGIDVPFVGILGAAFGASSDIPTDRPTHFAEINGFCEITQHLRSRDLNKKRSPSSLL